MKPTNTFSGLSRRQWLAASTSVAGLSLLPAGQLMANSLTNPLPNPHSPRWLDLQRSGERYLLNIADLQGWQKAAWLLRDESAQTSAVPDARLMAVLSWAQAQLDYAGQPRVMVVSSGLRTHKTNAAIEGAAEKSMHLPDDQGVFKAVDLLGSPARLDAYYELFNSIEGLGIGRYSTHLHVDTRGRNARWVG
ncbi:MAG: D-Ala-D-Ala carboxypeptidase family metallohydrolase [Limnobacter sp.]|nr:D-Ala-D-Ala carboxypeptidase family metallohydrolase [Limnobacter sp.]